jgi:hypothetical protein
MKPEQKSWFAHAAKFVGCYIPEPRTGPPTIRRADDLRLTAIYPSYQCKGLSPL